MDKKLKRRIFYEGKQKNHSMGTGCSTVYGKSGSAGNTDKECGS